MRNLTIGFFNFKMLNLDTLYLIMYTASKSLTHASISRFVKDNKIQCNKYHV